jgi:PTS system beta-glucosides-specific IIC component
MEVYKEGYAKIFQRYQNRKTAEYFADFGAFFLRECISPGSHTKTHCIFTRKEVIIMGFFSKLFGKSEKAPAFDGNKLYAPLNGKAVPITEVPDPTFAEGLLGNGIAILPTDGKIYSPVDGTVETMFDTGHAVCLKSKTGVEILIHVGLETVGLNGKPFKVHCKNGDTVRKGQLLLEADLAAIQAAGLPIITPVLVCNSDDYATFNVSTGKTVAQGEVVIQLDK